jgi:hypothetical protein
MVMWKLINRFWMLLQPFPQANVDLLVWKLSTFYTCTQTENHRYMRPNTIS